jgi:DNA-binding NtrC family response regulator
MDAVTDSHGPIWQGASVLVVDNETVMRSLVRRTLEAEDFQVEEAWDGESALALIQSRKDPFDLVLTDLSMPRIDGRQLSETLARYRPEMAVLCMSANPDAVPRIGVADTPIRVMLKPFTAQALYHAVRDAINLSARLLESAELEIAEAHAGLSRLAAALEASRTTRGQALDLVRAARELRRADLATQTPVAGGG